MYWSVPHHIHNACVYHIFWQTAPISESVEEKLNIIDNILILSSERYEFKLRTELQILRDSQFGKDIQYPDLIITFTAKPKLGKLFSVTEFLNHQRDVMENKTPQLWTLLYSIIRYKGNLNDRK